MNDYTATIYWSRGEQVFVDQNYNRSHQWSFDGGLTLPASSSPHIVKTPLSDPCAIDPEEAFVASLSSCHMLWFLDLAAARGFCINSYQDRAVGVMERNTAGRMAMSRVTLFPLVDFHGDRLPSASEYDDLHHQAHDNCFIAQSVKTTVLCKALYRLNGNPA